MDEQTRIGRILRLLVLLSSDGEYSVEYLARKVGVRERTIYRFINTLKSEGFTILKPRKGVYQIVSMDDKLPDISQLVMFTPEEAALVSSLIESIHGTNTLKDAIRRKLAAVCEVACLTRHYENKALEVNISLLTEAIREHRCAILHNYQSSTSPTRNRLVEPYEFSPNHIDVQAYEMEADAVKTFKVSRIGKVSVLERAWEHKDRHESVETDIFRMSGESRYHIRLRMDKRAKNLLLEEYPKSWDVVTREKRGESWILDTYVFDLAGVSRFVMGLIDHIEVIDSPELREHIIECMEKWKGWK